MLFVGEVFYIYARHTIGDQVLGIKKTSYMRPNPVSLYSPIPNAVGVHESRGNYKVKYFFDDKGRKKIRQNRNVSKTLHFFGDSFTFGYGVTNDDTALNLLAEKVNQRINIQNYGVAGYGIELMYLRLMEHIDEIKPGDVVVFSLTSQDLARGWPGRSRPCVMALNKAGPSLFPRIVEGKVEYVDVEQECSFLFDTLLSNTSFAFSIGRLYKSLRDRAAHQEIFASADEIFAEAKRLANSRGASFRLVFLPTPVECERQAHVRNIDGLKTPHLNLLQRCPTDPASLQALRFPSGAHLSPEGNRWAADVLYSSLGELETITMARPSD